MTMFRVLSEEEVKNVVRWKAPDHTGQALPVANTRQVAVRHEPPANTEVRPVHQPANQPALSGAARSRADQSVSRAVTGEDGEVSASAAPVAFAYRNQSGQHLNENIDSMSTATVALPNASADMLQASYDEGYARGFAEGNAELHQQSIKQLHTVLDSMNRAVSDYNDVALEQEVLAMSLKIAGLLVQREIESDPVAMQQLVHLGLQQLPVSAVDSKCVHLHPMDANRVRQLSGTGSGISIVDDPSLDHGQCRIEAGASVVHAGLDNWLSAMASQLGLSNQSELTIPKTID